MYTFISNLFYFFPNEIFNSSYKTEVGNNKPLTYMTHSAILGRLHIEEQEIQKQRFLNF